MLPIGMRQGDLMTFDVPYEPPLDWSFQLDYLKRRHSAGVEWIGDNQYSRTIEIDGDTGILTVRNEPAHSRLVVTILGDASRHAPTIRRRVRDMFDLESDQHEILAVLGTDPLVGQLRRDYPGIRIPGGWSAFELLVRTIVGQQVSVSAATTIMGRIIERTGRPVNDPECGRTCHLFPTPESVATADLAKIGMPGRRVAALQNIAAHIATNSIPFPDNDASNDEIVSGMLKLPGIGPWTVSYFALRALRDVDAWPGTDLILRRMLEKHPLAAQCSAKTITESWRPYRGYAAMHLWHASVKSVSP